MELTDAELALFSNDDAVPVWSAPLTTAVDLWNQQGYVQMHVPWGRRTQCRCTPETPW